MSEKMPVYECGKCGNRQEGASDAPECCGAIMSEVAPLPVCELSSTPEHARSDDIDEPCDDGRGG